MNEDAGGEVQTVGKPFLGGLPGGGGPGRDDSAHLGEHSLTGRRVGPVGGRQQRRVDHGVAKGLVGGEEQTEGVALA